MKTNAIRKTFNMVKDYFHIVTIVRVSHMIYEYEKNKKLFQLGTKEAW